MEWRVIFWHNDFPDGSRQNSFYGKDGPIFKRVLKNIASGASLKWHFHGGFIKPDRTNLLRRLNQADVMIIGCPWNMDINNDQMHWREAENSLLDILKTIKEKNEKIKIFFLLRPHHLTEEFRKIGKIVDDIHESSIYDYFRGE